MSNFFNRLDEYLIKKRPEVWLTKFHWYFPIAVLIILASVGLQFWLPFSVSIYTVLISSAVIAVILLLMMIRNQYMYFSKNLNPRQLHRIFWINFLSIIFIGMIAFAAPFAFSLKTQKFIKTRSFAEDEKQIRIAMINSDDLAIIKSVPGDIEKYMDSLLKTNPDEYRLFESKIIQVKENKFINQSLYQLNFSDEQTVNTAIADSTAVGMPADTTSAITDTTQIKAAPEETKKSLIDNYTWHSEFLDSLRAMHNARIYLIKKNIHNILDIYDFSRYKSTDSGSYSTNIYFETLNKQLLNIYTTSGYFSKQNIAILDILMIILFLFYFTILIFSLLLKVSVWEKAVALLVPPVIVFVTVSAFDSLLSNGTRIFIFVTLVLLIISLGAGMWQKTKKITAFRRIFLLALHASLVIALWYLLFYFFLAYFFQISFSENINSPEIIVFLAIYAISVFLFNKLFMKKYFFINNMPKD